MCIKMGVETCECKLNESKDQLPAKVEESIKKIIKKEGYTEYKVTTKAISTVGGNYFGSLYEVDVKGKTEDGDKETNIFVKGIVSGENMSVLSVTGMFTMELFFYNELAVVLDEIQNEANVPAKERYSIAKTYQESIPEAIILENLTRKGYKTVFRMDSVPLKFAELSIEQLGRLHGLSFALEKKRPDYFDRKIKSLRSPYVFNDDYNGLITNSSKVIAECLDGDARKRFTDAVPKLWENVQRYFNEEKYRTTIIHNDYRANNILMKEIDGEVTDVVPVDYQVLFYGCPILDFLYFIFLGTDQQFRRNHLEDLKELYYDSLTKMLKHFDVDVKLVFPREEFENMYSEVLDFGLFCFIQLMPFLFAVEDEIPQLDKDYLDNVIIKTDDRMKERARGVVDDFIQWGLL